MKFLLIYTLFFSQNNLELLESAKSTNDLGALVNTLSIGFMIIFALLIITLIKVYK